MLRKPYTAKFTLYIYWNNNMHFWCIILAFKINFTPPLDTTGAYQQTGPQKHHTKIRNTSQQPWTTGGEQVEVLPWRTLVSLCKTMLLFTLPWISWVFLCIFKQDQVSSSPFATSPNSLQIPPGWWDSIMFICLEQFRSLLKYTRV